MQKRFRKPQGFIFPVVFILILLLSGTCFGQPNRKSWQPPEKIMDIAGVTPGMIIGEVGAGRGFFTFPLADRVGPNGKVFANDINRYGLGRIRSRAEEEGINNIEIIFGETEDPLFPSKNLDMVIMVYVFHHLDEQVIFFENVKKYLKPGALVVIVERDIEEDPDQAHHFSSKEQVLEIFEKTEFELDRIDLSLSLDAIYIFRLKK